MEFSASFGSLVTMLAFCYTSYRYQHPPTAGVFAWKLFMSSKVSRKHRPRLSSMGQILTMRSAMAAAALKTSEQEAAEEKY